MQQFLKVSWKVLRLGLYRKRYPLLKFGVEFLHSIDWILLMSESSNHDERVVTTFIWLSFKICTKTEMNFFKKWLKRSKPRFISIPNYHICYRKKLYENSKKKQKRVFKHWFETINVVSSEFKTLMKHNKTYSSRFNFVRKF